MAKLAMRALCSAVSVSLCLPWIMAPVNAQEIADLSPDVQYLADSASPFGETFVSSEEASAIAMPDLAGPVTSLDEENFDKYYYFHRDDTDLATAFSDISECDGYARGLATGYRYQDAPYPYAYSMAGVAGAAIGNLMVAAISALRKNGGCGALT